jgi:hypothetical protein
VVDHFGKAYVAGNVVEGNERVTSNNWDGGVQPDSKAPLQEVLPKIRVEQPFEHAPVTVMPARDAYEYVLANSGATLPKRDPVDVRVAEMVRTGKVTAKTDGDAAASSRGVKFSDEVIKRIVEDVDRGISATSGRWAGIRSTRGRR